jgi:sterol desaturase/sphingolipid hydroxylase (fatty acid hydroxylase superfamily)
MHPFAHLHHPAFGGHARAVAPILVLAVGVEMIWRVGFARKGYDFAEAVATLGVAACNLFAGALTSAVLAVAYGALWTLAPIHWPLGDWRTWVIGFLVVEFAYYWFHRLSHEVRWLWATHAVHHTPEQITLLSAIRLG